MQLKRQTQFPTLLSESTHINSEVFLDQVSDDLKFSQDHFFLYTPEDPEATSEDPEATSAVNFEKVKGITNNTIVIWTATDSNYEKGNVLCYKKETPPVSFDDFLTNLYQMKVSEYFEKALTNFLDLSLPSNPKKALEYLDLKLEKARKTVDLFNAYQIRGELTNPLTLEADIAVIPLNSGYVYNGSEAQITLNEETITVVEGDIFIRDYNNHLIFIKSLSGGYYYPAQYQDSKLTYKFAKNAPDTGSSSDIGTTEISTEPAETMGLNITSESSNPIYNQMRELAAGQTLEEDIPYATYEETDSAGNKKTIKIYPNIYIYDANNQERIFIDNIMIPGKDGNHFKLKNDTTIPLKFYVR